MWLILREKKKKKKGCEKNSLDFGLDKQFMG